MKTELIELQDRVTSETPTAFVNASNFGIILTGVGLTLRIAAAIFPATMPIGLISLAPEIISIGVTMIVGSQTVRRDKADKSPLKKTLITKIIDFFRKK